MKNIQDGGEAILEAFRSLKVDYVISSPGSEWPSLWDALARQPGPPFASSMLRGADIREADPRWTIVSETDECARVDLMSTIGADMHKNLHAGRLIWGLVHAEIAEPKS